MSKSTHHHPPSQEPAVSRPWRNAGVLRSLGEGGPASADSAEVNKGTTAVKPWGSTLWLAPLAWADELGGKGLLRSWSLNELHVHPSSRCSPHARTVRDFSHGEEGLGLIVPFVRVEGVDCILPLPEYLAK